MWLGAQQERPDRYRLDLIKDIQKFADVPRGNTQQHHHRYLSNVKFFPRLMTDKDIADVVEEGKPMEDKARSRFSKWDIRHVGSKQA